MSTVTFGQLVKSVCSGWCVLDAERDTSETKSKHTEPLKTDMYMVEHWSLQNIIKFKDTQNQKSFHLPSIQNVAGSIPAGELPYYLA